MSLYLLKNTANIFVFQIIEIVKTNAIPNLHSNGQFSADRTASSHKGVIASLNAKNETANTASMITNFTLLVFLRVLKIVLLMRHGFASSPSRRVMIYSSPP